jgi:hypothetical protein
MHFNIYLDDDTGERLIKAAKIAGENRNAVSRRTCRNGCTVVGNRKGHKRCCGMPGTLTCPRSRLATRHGARIGIAV